jgi:hypothetical protein
MGKGRTFVRVRHNPWILGLATLPFFAGLAALLAGPPTSMFAVHGALGGVIAILYAWYKNPLRRDDPVRVRVDDDALVLGEERVPRAELKKGLMTAGGKVQLSRGFGKEPIELEADEAAHGRKLLANLGLSATQTVAEFRGASLVFQETWRVVALIPVFLAAFFGASVLARHLHVQVPTLIIPLLVVYLGLYFWPSYVGVGADGVLLRWAWHRRFVRYDEILAVGISERGFGNSRRKVVELTLEGRETLVIPMGQVFFGSDSHALLAERIDEALEAHRSNAAVHDAALLDRGDRSHRDWVASLGALRDRMSHRKAPVAPATLWRIVEDASTAPLERAAAAIALRGFMDDEERTRLAGTARATVAPRLRIALDAAASRDASDEELAAALAELEEEASEARS